MCSPVSVAAIGLQGVGLLQSAFGAKAGAQAQQEQLNLQASMGDINARMSETRALQLGPSVLTVH